MPNHTRVVDRSILAGLLVGVALLVGCASSTPVAFAPPTPTPPPGDYVVQPGDTLTVKFYYHPDHDQDVIVRTDGKIVMPLVGDVPAAGMTPAKLAEQLTRAHSKNLRDPVVAVSVKAMNENHVFVGGEVTRPGFVQYRQGLTAIQAMLEVGGPKDTGKVEEVVLLRRVGDSYQASKIDLARAFEEGDARDDLKLGPSDVVFVPKTGIAKLNQFVDQYIMKVIPVRPGISAIAPIF